VTNVSQTKTTDVVPVTSGSAVTLYLMQKGNWYVGGAGRAITDWEDFREDNSRSGRARIISITAEEAMEWLQAAVSLRLQYKHEL